MTTTPPAPPDAPVERSAGRLDTRLAWLTLAAALCFVAITMGASLLGLRVFAPVDRLTEVAPWAPTSITGLGPAPHNDFVRDPLDAEIPRSHEFAERLRVGDLGSWSSTQVGGSYLGATPNLGATSPVAVPYLVLPTWLAPAATKLLELIVALGGCYLYLRRLRLGRAAAVVGGLAFATSAFLTMWTGWTQVRVAAFIPLLFWSVERAIASRQLREIAAVALAVACLILGGFPSVTAYALYTAAAYALVRALVTYGRHLRDILAALGRTLAGVVIGVTVTAVQLVPFVDQLGQVDLGDRAQTPDSFLPATSLVTTFAPYAFGAPGRHDSWGGPRNPIESYSFVGAVVIALIAVGAVATIVQAGRAPAARASMRTHPRRGVVWFFVAATTVWGAAAYSGGSVLRLLQQLPAMDWNAIGRARSVLGFFVAVLAAVAFQVVLDGRPARTAATDVSSPTPAVRGTADALLDTAVAAVAAGGVAAMLAGLVRHSYGWAAEVAARDTYVRGVAVGAAVLLVAALAAAAAWLSGGASRWASDKGARRLRAGALAALPLMLAAQATAVAQPFWTQADRADFYPVTATHAYLLDHVGHDRILAVDGAMMSGTNAFYGIRSLDGHSFIRREMADLIRVIDPSALRVPTLPQISLASAVAEPELLDRLAVRYLVAPPGDDVPGARELVGSGGARVVLQPESTVDVTMPAGGLRAVGVLLADARPADAEPVSLEVRVLDAAGQQVAYGERLVEAGTPRGPALVALATADGAFADAAFVRAQVTVHGGQLALSGAGGAPQLYVVRPAADGLTVVHAGDATVYERTTALPRVRWAESTAPMGSLTDVVTAIRTGTAPDVLLAGGVVRTAGDAGAATVEVTADSGDAIAATVRAPASGYLVVADALQRRFVAKVDGATVPLVAADHAYVAVAVPAGTHTVSLTYRAPYAPFGLVLSAAAALAVLGLLVPTRRSRRLAAWEQGETPGAQG